MNIDIAPETAQLVRESIDSSRFRSMDELIKAGLEAWREKIVSRRKQVSGPSG
jgi:Arc/MetJ-type ribon-helix-helix transcriptional regulator